MGALTVLSQSLPRRLEFVQPRLFQNGLIHHDAKKSTNDNSTKTQAIRLEAPTRWNQTFGAAAGLHNLGNTCFLNSILQCLTHTAPLANFVLAHRQQLCARKPFCFLCFLKSHIAVALGGGQALAPRALVGNLRYLSRSFKTGRQEDAHEFLCKCLEALEKSCQPKLVEALWGGKFRSRVRCHECSYASDAFDPFQDISLEILHAKSVVAALKHFTAPEILSGNNKYMCSGCKRRVVAHKQLTIDQAPPVLTIQLKRFTHTGAKISKEVQYYHRLDLGPFLSNQGSSVCYTLFGLVVHIGSGPRSGHYVAYVKSAAGPWYEMDDSSVRKIGADAVLKQMPYLLFYSLDSPEQTPAPKSAATPNRAALSKPRAWPSPPANPSVPMTAVIQVPKRPVVVPENDVLVCSANDGDTPVNENTGGDCVAACPVEAISSVPVTPRSLISLPRQWRHHTLTPTRFPPGHVDILALKAFKSIQPIPIAAWTESQDQSLKMSILREHRDLILPAQRSEYDREYDRGKVRKVKKRPHLDTSSNLFQDVVNKRIRSL